MRGLFLQTDAIDQLWALDLPEIVRIHALDVVENGYTVIQGAVPPETCAAVIAAFRRNEAANPAIFAANQNPLGHYPRIVNLHNVMPELTRLFTRNNVYLAVLDALFGAPASLYTSLFYEIGSQQPLHRDTPVFSTRPEYHYFGSTVYLEDAGAENGCLEVLEGGHLMPELDREEIARRRYGDLDKIPALDGDAWMEYQDTVVANGKSQGMRIRDVPVKAGDTLIWHPQLPHGGTPIRDPNRTRFSLVMHVTPEGIPVYHQNAFFAPSKEFSERPGWGYYEVDGRQIADQRHGVSFGHDRNYTLDQFKTA